MKLTSYFVLLALLVMTISSLFNARPAEAQSGIQVQNAGAWYQFGAQITFVAMLNTSTPVQSAAIVISDESQSLNRIEPLVIQPDGRLEFRLDTKQNSLR